MEPLNDFGMIRYSFFKTFYFFFMLYQTSIEHPVMSWSRKGFLQTFEISVHFFFKEVFISESTDLVG